MGQRETDFDAFLPHFTDKEATAFFSQHQEMVSVNGRNTTPDFFTVIFANRDRTFGPLSLNPFVAQVLCKMLIDAGYAPSLQPPRTKA